jgi:DNA-binding NarL/FixJ family response regulator
MDISSNRNEQIKIILLANQPRMLREMLHRALDKTPDVRLVLETDKPKRIPKILDRVRADWLITSLDEEDQLPQPVREAIEQNPSVSVLGLSADGSHVEVRGARSDDGNREGRRYSLENISLAELLTILEDDS